LIEEAGGSVYLSGISSGAALALEVASRGPAIKKLALYETPFMVDDSHPRDPEDSAEQLNGLVTRESARRRSRLRVRRSVRPLERAVVGGGQLAAPGCRRERRTGGAIAGALIGA
jgi:hypothetical protein